MHWDPKHLQKVDKLQSFGEMAELAFEVLRPLKQKAGGKPVVQICGPMSTGGIGITDTLLKPQEVLNANMRIFALAIEHAHNNGIIVFNQLPFQSAMMRFHEKRTDQRSYFEEILTEFYHPVLTSGLVDAASFLPNWPTSRGARYERNLTESKGLIIQEYCPDMFAKVMQQYRDETNTGKNH